MLVYIDGKAFVTTYVQSQTLMAAHGPDMLRREPGNISAEIIQGNPFAPNDLMYFDSTGQHVSHAQEELHTGTDHVAPKIIIAAVAAFPPAIVLGL